ncbi:MAG: ABC-F family ATP-binding cassette domain-containing protein [Oscillospiraceae bacterium]|nr:ABC-F family ATP-binding cassette domain-containing protein [Oscillospiraceae bacterium]
MVLLNASNLKKMFLDETLFDGVSFNIAEGDKIGFVGVNGAGKSTLFKIINEMMEYDSGELYRNKLTKIGYLDQHTCIESDKTIMGEMLGAFSEVISIENELEEIRFDIENKNGDINTLVSRQTALQERFEKLDGYQYKSRIRSALIGLGFTEEDFNRRVDELSGGQKTRVSLGRLLLSDANLLLLDEPTNHLDIESVEWLEGFLESWRGSFVIISHDRYFLDKVTNRTFEMDCGRLRTYTGGYSEYLKQREVERKTEERSYQNTMREIERLEGIVEQQRRWNREKNIKTAESKQKVIDKLTQTLVVPESEQTDIRFSFKSLPGGGNDVLITENLGMSFDGKRIFKDCSAHITKGEKVFLLGSNGCGKTTFIKDILGMYEPTEGSVKIGANIAIGYYDQIQENLDMEKTVFDEVHDEYPEMTQTEIRNALAIFLFRGEDVFKEIKKLSGGERARVELAKLMLRPVNFLIMDEPTNHLDIDSREALEGALADYDGTMLMVSHDRYFINKLADRVLYMTEDGLKSYIGGYDDYVEAKARQRISETEAATAAEKPKNLDYQEQKRLQAEKRKTLNRFRKVEELIEQLEGEVEALSAEMTKPEYVADFTKLAELSKAADDKNKELESLMEEWESLQIEIEEKGYEI